MSSDGSVRCSTCRSSSCCPRTASQRIARRSSACFPERRQRDCLRAIPAAQATRVRECSPMAPEGYGDCVTRDDNRRGLARAYSEETWRVYEFLDISLDPRGLDSLYEFAAPHLGNDSRILDAGCRNAKHLIELIRRYEGTGVGVDPVAIHVSRAHDAIAAADLSAR